MYSVLRCDNRPTMGQANEMQCITIQYDMTVRYSRRTELCYHEPLASTFAFFSDGVAG